MGLSRRAWMKIGAGGLATITVGGVGLGLRASVLVSPRRPLKVLTGTQFSVLAAFAERVTPAVDVGRGLMPRPWDLEVPEQVDDLLSRVHPADAAEVAEGLEVIESAAAGLLLDGRTQTFTASGPEEQDRIIDAWRTSDLPLRRKAFKALNALCAASYCASPAVFPFLGYTGPGYVAAGRAEGGTAT